MFEVKLKSYTKLVALLAAIGILAGCATAKPPVEVVEEVVVEPVLDSDGDGVPDNLDQCPNSRPGAVVDANGCEIIVRFPATFFAFDSAEINPEGYALLNEAAAAIAEFNLNAVEIAGHTDSVGPEAYNKKLGYERAESVAQYFIDQGLNPAIFSIVSFGEEDPVASNDTREGRAQNRRVYVIDLAPNQ